MLHYKHHAVQDPFYLPGICDITAHVDWTGIANAAHPHQMNLLGYTNQAAYLLDAGIGELALRDANPNEADSFLKISNNLQKLLSEAEMGELFKVMCLGKNLEFSEGELPGFRGRPRAL
jgi:SAM-dependent MidA family methyltransferase